MGTKNLWQQKGLFSLPICYKFQNDFFKIWFLYTFLMILYMYIAPGQGQKTPGDKLWMSTESPYHFDHLLQVSNKSRWILILYTYFNVFPRMYIAPGQGQTPFVDKILMSTERPCHFAHLLQVSKKYLWSLIFLHIFACFYTCISPRGRGRQSPWVRIFM